ncbi:MAG: hypothetical protein ACI4V7_09440 [Succinivibrionaceae bacterium]
MFSLDLIKLRLMNDNIDDLLDKLKHTSFAFVYKYNTFADNYACIRIYNYMYNIIKDIFDKGWDHYPVMYSSEKFINELCRDYFKDFYIDENTLLHNLGIIIKLINEETLIEINVVNKKK